VYIIIIIIIIIIVHGSTPGADLGALQGSTLPEMSLGVPTKIILAQYVLLSFQYETNSRIYGLFILGARLMGTLTL